MKTYKFECAFCRKKYKIEKAFLAHACKVKERIDETKTMRGQRAYELFSTYMRQKFNTSVTVDQFINSSYYIAFHKFADFSKKVGLVDIPIYLKIMDTKSLTPDHWSNPLAYSFYLENIDKFIKPEKQIEISVNTILDVCEEYDKDTSEFFELISPADLVEMITARELSPWLVLNSDKFMNFYRNELSSHFKRELSQLIDGKHWSMKMKLHSKTKKIAKECVKELML